MRVSDGEEARESLPPRTRGRLRPTGPPLLLLMLLLLRPQLTALGRMGSTSCRFVLLMLAVLSGTSSSSS